MNKNLLSIPLIFLMVNLKGQSINTNSNNSYKFLSDIYIGISGDTKSPFGFQIGKKQWNLFFLVGSKKTNRYTPNSYGSNSTERRNVRRVLGYTKGFKFFNNCYFDLGISTAFVNDVVIVSNPILGSYNYDPGDYKGNVQIGGISGISFYFEKGKLNLGTCFYNGLVTLQYGLCLEL